MFQHDVSTAHPYASRSRLMQRRRHVGFLLIVAGGMVLACFALSLRPGLKECTPLVRCEGWYPLAPIGLLFVFMGILFLHSRSIPFTDEEALARRLYKEILAEYVRGWVIFRLFVSVLLILAGAAALFSLTSSFAWAPLLGGVSGTLLGSGILVHACLLQREERDGEARK